ncbi:gamma-glutamyl-gamma-aminobutyrate hydrolase family protein [Fusobacterium gonidiaformans]|uniref:gamma-glutamyl-gamma-aminobutyrate hydrolase family protein n=1 Tax=Fusobacterium gonidiaformans TaxID=849 RepID=UPI0001BC665F|nr:gamma-glutamyl-gamma-aminobutyrate hydrolase family protein [Fusobacterium gonidiaformans]AVQ16782.1 gamma-glutamyl-gamma-aminobutyrate hydrolase [Fusobacterium gonidiaformans ATCC 25563]EFS28358.1 hypothetical protein FGAG_00679 [Fusobacterium gonidiaformans ATCC 25563]
MKALIGITGSIITCGNDEIFATYERAYVNDDYVSAVEKAGGIPIILPIVEEEENIKEFVSRVDAIVLSGGYDIDPSYWGEEIGRKYERIYPRRDHYEMLVIKYAKELKKPVLGICRGHQMINVAFGGSLYQDLSEIPGSYIQHVQQAKYYEATHGIEIEEGSFISKSMGVKNRVNSYHHLAIKDLGNSLRIVGRAPDGVVEAIEYITEEQFFIGVQFHPEMMHRHHEFALHLFQDFIQEVERRKK